MLLDGVRKAVEKGLSEEAALAALTTTPAKTIRASHLVGSIKSGAMANILVSDSRYFKRRSGARTLGKW